MESTGDTIDNLMLNFKLYSFLLCALGFEAYLLRISDVSYWFVKYMAIRLNYETCSYGSDKRLSKVHWYSRISARLALTIFAVNGRLRCANRPYSKAGIACFDHLHSSTPRTANRHIGRGLPPIPPVFF